MTQAVFFLKLQLTILDLCNSMIFFNHHYRELKKGNSVWFSAKSSCDVHWSQWSVAEYGYGIRINPGINSVLTTCKFATLQFTACSRSLTSTMAKQIDASKQELQKVVAYLRNRAREPYINYVISKLANTDPLPPYCLFFIL